MKRKIQCKNKFIFIPKKLVSFCIREKGHKGLHKFIWAKALKSGRVSKKRYFFTE